MARLVLEFLARSGALAALIWSALARLRIRSAAARHAAWTGMLLAMLFLPFWITAGPRLALHWLPAAPPGAASVVPAASAIVVVPDEAISSRVPSALQRDKTKPEDYWAAMAAGTYLLVAGYFLLRLGLGTLRACRLVRGASGRLIRTSASCNTPVTAGLFRPTIVLPVGWRRWPRAQLGVVLAHERAHVRRHDPLVQWLAQLNRAVFWFHPLAWWLANRLAALAEEACDAAVLAAGFDARSYSLSLLEIAREQAAAGGRFDLAAVAMPGSALSRRIHALLENGVAPRLSRLRSASLALACVTAFALAGATNMERAPARRAIAFAVSQQPAGSAKNPAPHFDVVSVKPCADTAPGRTGERVTSSPGGIDVPCFTLRTYIQWAYIRYAGGRFNPTVLSNVPIEGGPDWIASPAHRFSMAARTSSPQSAGAMFGPMLQAALADKFQLKLHYETRQVPVFELVVAKGGSKLVPFDGSCTPSDYSSDTLLGATRPADSCRSFGRGNIIQAKGQTLDEFTNVFLPAAFLGRPVINKTGLSGRFDINLDLSPYVDPDSPNLAAEIIVALSDVGLKLMPANGPGRFIVVDHAEPPPPN